MKVFHSIEDIIIQENPVATIGTFDGVHIGHQEIISHLISEAKKRETKSLLITFDPHPRITLQKAAETLFFINDIEEKTNILDKLGLDYLIILPFSLEFSKISARNFIQNYLIAKFNIQAMVIGYNHHFGNMNDENSKDVTKLLKEFNIDVETIPEIDVQSISISSTKIRKAINEGDMQLANELLGHPYSFKGKVVHGTKLGRDLGFPTANLELEYKLKLLPIEGVYAVSVSYEGKTYQGMMNIGFRPTTNNFDKTIEVNIFNFNENIYGKYIKVSVLCKIRSEQKFESINELKKQLKKDKLFTQNFFTKL